MKTCDFGAYWIPLGASFLILCIAFIVFRYAHPLADDYCRASAVDQGIIENIVREHVEFSGRWASHVIEYLGISYINIEKQYSILLLLISIIYFISLAMFFYGISENAKIVNSVFIATIVYAIYWSGIQSPGTAVYWFSGSVEYQLSVAMILLLFGSVMLIRKRNLLKIKNSKMDILLIAFLAFWASGFHELHTIAGIYILTTIIVYIMIFYKKIDKYLLTALIVFIGGFAVIYSAPGTGNRIEVFQEQQAFGRMWFSLVLGAQEMVRSLARWILDPRMITFSLIYILYPELYNMYIIHNDRYRHKNGIIFTTCWLILIAILFFVPGYALGRTMPGRAHSSIYMYFIIGWICLISIYRPLIHAKIRSYIEIKASTRTIIGFAFCVSMLLTGNSLTAITEMSNGTLSVYHVNKQNMYSSIDAKKELNDDNIIVAGEKLCPKMMYCGGQVTSDKYNWINRCVAEYYGLESISIGKMKSVNCAQRME